MLSHRLSRTTLAAAATVLAMHLHPTTAHSWLDCIDHSYDVVYTLSDKWVLAGAKGNGICEGYAYNFPGRGVGTIGTDFTHELLPKDIKDDSVAVCQYQAQDANYTGWRRAVEAKAGDKLYFAYFSSGRVVKGKAGPGTTDGVYWDGRPGVQLEKPSQLTKEHLVDEQLQDFDNGNCGQTFADGDYADGAVPSGRAGDFKPCIGSFTIPKGTKAGTYPMVWWRTFFKADDVASGFQGAGGAAYSSCFDVIVKDATGDTNETGDAVQGEAEVRGAAAGKYSMAGDGGDKKEEPSQPARCGVAGDDNGHGSDTPAKSSPTAGATSDQTNSYTVETPSSPAPTTSAPAPAPTPSTPAPTTSVLSLTLGTPAPTPSALAPIATSSTPAPAPTTSTPAPTTSAPAPTTSAPSPTLGTPAPTPSTPGPTTSAPTTTPAPTTSSPTPFVTSNIFAAPLSTITISDVGGKGTYGKVTNMLCPGTDGNTCEQTPVDVNSPLAPFDEDLTLALRGPLEVDDIAVFTKDEASAWSKVSSYSKSKGNAAQNMVFLNNKGDQTKSGEFSMCHGNSQSFATSDGTTAANSSSLFSGVLADGVEVNVMSDTKCSASGASCGFARGVAHEGWRGEHKIFMVKAQMPHSGDKDLPAIWLLNGQVVRTAEYGCNCRGEGDKGPWKGGCGELDVAEVIAADKEMLTSTIYSFKGSRGASPVMARPVDGRVVFIIVFSPTGAASGSGVVQILMMRPDNVDMENAPSPQRVEEWLNYRTGPQVDFKI